MQTKESINYELKCLARSKKTLETALAANAAKQKELEELLVDKNAFCSHLQNDCTSTRTTVLKDLVRLNQALFGQTHLLQLLDGSTPADRPELQHRSFVVEPKCKVKTTRIPCGRTIIEIIKR